MPKALKQGLQRFRSRRRWRRFRFWLLGFVILVLVIGIPGAGLWLNFVGLGPYARSEAELALAKVGIQATMSRLVLNPFNGLVARDVRVGSIIHPGRDVATVRSASLSVRWSALLKRRLEFEKIEVHGGEVFIEFENAEGIRLDHIQATLFFYPGQVRVSRASFHVNDIEFTAAGTLLNPEKLRAPETKPASSQPSPDKVVNEINGFLERTRFTGRPPTVDIGFAGDLADLASIRLEHIRLRVGAMEQPGWKITSLAVDGDYYDGVLALRSIEVRDAAGRMMATANWKTTKGELSLELESSLDIRPFLPPDSQPLKDWRFVDSPEFSVHGTLRFENGPLLGEMSGDLHAGRFVWRDVAFDRFDTSFAWRDGDFYIKDASLRRNGGVLDADVLIREGDVRIRLESDLNPQVFFQFADAKARETLDLLVVKDAPEVRVSLQGDKLDFASLHGTGNIRLGRTILRGVEIESATAKLEIADKAITYRDLEVKRPEGVGTGTVVYDMANHEARLQNIVARLNPADVLTAFDVKLGEAVRPYRFRAPPKVTVDGMIHLKDQNKNRLDVTVDAREGLDYDLAGKTLPFRHTQGTLRFRGPQLTVDLPRAELFSGNVKLRTEVSLDPARPQFQATVIPDGVEFLPLSRLYFRYEKTQGLLSGRYQFRASLKDPKKMTGEGSIKVKDGNVFAMPVLGALSDIIEGVLPGLGYQNARQASADFRVVDGVVETDNFLVEGKGFLMQGEGELDLIRDKMDFSIRINARGVPGILLYPVSKVFEYVSDGKLSHPEWRPRILPKMRPEP